MFFIKKVAITATIGVGLLGGTAALADSVAYLNPYCESNRSDGLVLNFQNARVYAPQAAQRIPLKMMLTRSCGIGEFSLKNIERIVVVGQSYTPYSILWLDGEGIQSYSQYLYAGSYGGGHGGRDGNRVSFDLNGYTPGRLQLLIQGDMLLDKIRVRIQGMTPPPGPGPGPFPGPGPGPFPGPGPGPFPGPGPHPSLQTYQIECSSIDVRTRFCQVPGLVNGHLINQLSQSPCIQNRSFWIQQNQGITVASGCRAIFQVSARR